MTKKKKSKKKKFDEQAFYKKYPHVVKGSIKEVDSVHGRTCKIECQETGKLRVINVQDAFQVMYCEEVQKRRSRERAAERRRKKAKKSKKK